MTRPNDLSRRAVIARALRVKRINAFAAILAGAALVVASAKWHSSALSPLTFVAGLLAGFIYANAFEYVLHRFVLHWGNGFLVQRHALHHDSAGAADEARYVNFATSPAVVVGVILLNAPVVIAAERYLHAGIAAGMFAGFTAYYIAYEEIHWRFHIGGYLPRWMNFARHHHMLHHGDFEGRYNVFLPLFDWIFQRQKWKTGARGPHDHHARV